MNKRYLVDKTRKRSIIIISSILGLVIVAASLYSYFLFNPKQNSDMTVIQQGKNIAKIETNGDKVTDTVSSKASSTASKDQTNTNCADPGYPNNSGPLPTCDNSGYSIKLDRRSDIHNVALTVSSIYDDYLTKLKSVPTNQRQSIADQYMTDNSSYFSSNFISQMPPKGTSLYLLPQSASIDLPVNIRVYSALIDPNDPSKAIVQVFMDPDTSWSLILVVNLKDSLDNFGTFEKIMPRMNQNPL